MQTIPNLITPGRIATVLKAPLHRVQYILATRDHIIPIARAGGFRLYDADAVVQVRHELAAIDARKGAKHV